MSQFARENPEDWAERLEAMRDQADTLRKQQRDCLHYYSWDATICYFCGAARAD